MESTASSNSKVPWTPQIKLGRRVVFKKGSVSPLNGNLNSIILTGQAKIWAVRIVVFVKGENCPSVKITITCVD